MPHGAETSPGPTNGVNGEEFHRVDGVTSNLKRSTQKEKKGLLYDIIPKKKRKRQPRGSTKKRASSRQYRIRQYFKPTTTPACELDTEEETDKELEVPRIHDTTIQNNTKSNTSIFTPESLQSRGWDKIDINATNMFRLLTNN
eukprot:4975704-Ditylum_brightwellii.AAC.1